MKKIALIVILLYSFSGYAQPYGNEWINYNQTYYNFPIAETGIYHISYDALVEAGIPLQSIDPRNIQIFSREKEVPILIEGESDGIFDTDDVIEFMAFKNDGWLDSLIYETPEDQNNPHYSLFNDTLTYFITWNDEINNERIELITETNFGDYPTAPYIWKENISFFTNNYWNQATGTSDLVSSYYEESEGWWGTRFGFPQGALTYTYNLSNPFLLSDTNLPDPILTAVTCGRNNANSSSGVNHHLQTKYGDNDILLEDTLFTGFQLNKFKYLLDANELGNVSTPVSHSVVNDLNLEADYIVISWMSLKYPHQLRPDDNDDFQFELAENVTGDFQSLTLTEVAVDNGFIYNLGEEITKTIPAYNGTTLDALIPNVTNQKSVLSYPDSVKQVSQILPVSNSGQFTNFGEISIDSAFVIVTHPTLFTEANEYASYRTNENRDALVVNIEELYDQFGGGIDKHELSVRRFSDLILDTWSSKPGHLFLLGKSIQVFNTRKNVVNFQNNLVPSFGFPTSDNLITAGLNNSLLEPAIPTGRLSALTPIQVSNYLDKVMTFENQLPAEWMKHVMHFGGGENAAEQNLFADFLDGYKGIIQDTCFGGKVHTFLKNSALPIQVNLSDSISDRIADGTSIMTFFGHANGSSFDYSIDQPENLVWNDHFPLFIGNSCFTGNIHTAGQTSTSEDYVLIPDKGAIAFIANVNLGYSSGLNTYTNRLYQEMAKFSYGKSIGEQIQKTVQNIQGVLPSEVVTATSLGMTLEGDPSLVINSPGQPDLSISEGDILINEDELNILNDSISVNVVITNIGKSTNASFEVELLRHYPSGQADSSYTQVVNGINYKDTLTFSIPLDFIQAIGINVFDVNIDLPLNTLAELDDFSNNFTSSAILISAGSALPVFPYNFAIVGEENITLKASTGNPFEESQTYRFDIDKSPSYNTSFFQSLEVTQTGGILSWELPFSLEDSLVYHWRVSADSTSDTGYLWNESSFQYIPDQVGWSQSDFYQKADNDYSNTIQNNLTEEFEFLTGSKELKCQVLGGSLSQSEASEFRIDGEVIEYSGCQNLTAIHVAIIDPTNLDPWGTNYNGQNPENNFGQVNRGIPPCRQRVENYFIFQESRSAQMDSLQSLLENKIPDGHYVLMYSWRYADHDRWDQFAPWLYDKFTELGAPQIASAENLLPFIFMTKMGSPESTVEIVGNGSTDYIELYYDLERTGINGRMRSPLIGPATSWDRIWWKTSALENPSNDVSEIKILGIENNGTEIEIPSAVFDGDITAEEDLSSLINPEQYAYIRLEGNYLDSITQSPAQQDAWHINYGVAPDAALNAQLAFGMTNDTVQEGQVIEFFCAIENISTIDMDSLLVSYWVEDASQQKYEIPYPRQDSLRKGDALIDTIQFNTTGLNGFHRFWIEVNPFNYSLSRYDQLEQYHFNNIAHLPFIVTQDNENPILDVVFDGIHILDGEIVSARPNIVITLDDENPYLLMNEASDTSYFSVFLTDPSGLQKRINFQENESYSLVFNPASDASNISSIDYQPILPLDGEYKLLVIASDKSGNASGDINYEINFSVDHESAVSEVLNYPNPFSTKTHFVFTLTGEAVPDNIKIQIMTVSGRIVKTIFKEDLGLVRIGRNITDYAWDGRDNFGDPLANGVYIYRVTITNNGEDVEYKETSASKYFKNGFGKMYILR